MAFALVTTLVFGSMNCFASVIPPQGPGQIGLSSVVPPWCCVTAYHYTAAPILSLKQHKL